MSLLVSLTDILFICVNAEARLNGWLNGSGSMSGSMAAKRGNAPTLTLVPTGNSHQTIAAQALQRVKKGQQTKQPTKIAAPQALQGGQKHQETNQETMGIMAILKDPPTKEMRALLDDQGKPVVVSGKRERKQIDAFKPGAHVVQRLSKVKPQSTQHSYGNEDPIGDFSDEDSERQMDDSVLHGPLLQRPSLVNGKRKAAPPNFFKPDSRGLQHLPKVKDGPVAEGRGESSGKRQRASSDGDVTRNKKIQFAETDQVRTFDANETLRYGDKTSDRSSVQGKIKVRRSYDYVFH